MECKEYHTDSELLTQFHKYKNIDFPLGKSNPCDNIGGVAGVAPAERVATNEVGAQGETSPS